MKQKNITTFIAIFAFILLNSIIAFKIYQNKYISKDIVRLHVVANSNSIEDQIIKLKTESKIQDYLSSLDKTTKTNLIENIKENKDTILKISDSTIQGSNQTYGSTLKVGKISYDNKESMELDMSKGTYDSACIILGQGNGKNIWSIIFPNEKTLQKLKQLDTILPGLSDIYTHFSSQG